MTTSLVNYFEYDVNEPKDQIAILAQSVPLIVAPLNVQGFADYRWKKYDGKFKQVERKTWGEVLGNLDHQEEQLQRHLTKNPDIELVFMLEGMVAQTEFGTNIIQSTSNGRIYSLGQRYNSRLSGIYAWLYEISNYLTVVQTHSIRESAVALTAMYNHDQKDNHSTFKRHIKQVASSPNPMVTTLMGASQGLGDKRANELIKYAGTPWNIWSAGFCEHVAYSDKNEFTKLDGIGQGVLTNVYRSIGRPDV